MSNDLVETLDRLSAVESAGSPILSVYLNVDPVHKEWMAINPRLKGLLDPAVELAVSGELDHVASTDLRRAIEDVLAMSGPLERPSASGVGIFVGPGIGLREIVDIPGRIWDCAVVGPRPYLRPLQAAVAAVHRIAVAIVDPRMAEISTFRSGESIGKQTLEADHLRKTNLAGWYGLDELRNRQHAEEVRNHLFREVAERLDHMWRGRGVDLVLVGGQHHVTQAFVPFLQPAIRAIAQTFVVDIHTLTPESLAERVTEMERDYQTQQETREVEEVYSLAAEGGLGVVGLDDVFAAASLNAVSQLFVQGGATIRGAVCSRCGGLSRLDGECGTCGGETREVPDVIEELIRAVIDAAGSVRHVMAETPLTTDLVAARLRFGPGSST